MELMEAIEERRSIRRFTEQALSEEQLKTLLKAIQWAPSWANYQVWEVILATDPEMKRKLSQTMEKNPASRGVAEAPVVFVLGAKLKTSGSYEGKFSTDKGDWFMFDLGLAAQNLCLAAHSLGLGSVIVGLFDTAKVEELLGFPDGYCSVVIIPVGYPAKKNKIKKRRAIDDFTHQERF